MGDGLRHAFNQNQGRDGAEAQRTPTPTGLNVEDEKDTEDKAFVRCNTDPNLYNTESGQIPMNTPDLGLAETGSNRVRRTDQQKRINRVKLGDTLSYRGTEGTVVARQDTMVKLAENESHIVSVVPISETYYKSDIIGDGNVEVKMWDLMHRDQRVALLSKHGMVTDDVQKAYLYREWLEIPEETREILKLETTGSSGTSGPSHGGMAGREPDFSGRNEESRSFRQAMGPKHIHAPYADKQAPAFSKDKSDVEHGVYGGVVTDTPIDATDEYEDERPKSKPLSGAQTAINEGPSGQTGAKRTVGNEPKDPKESEGIHDRWSETRKQTHEPSTTPEELAGTTKDGDRGVGQDSSGWQGAKPNAQASEKGEQQQAAITGKPDLKKEDEEEVDKATQDLASITGEGSKKKEQNSKTGPSFGDGPIRTKNIINKNNTRWGPRQASQEDIQAFYDKQ